MNHIYIPQLEIVRERIKTLYSEHQYDEARKLQRVYFPEMVTKASFSPNRPDIFDYDLNEDILNNEPR
jgi:hypothetical protein